MNLVLIVLVVIIGLFILKNLKHHLVRKSITIAFSLFVVVVILMFLSSYFDMGSIFSRESIFAKTGAAVVDTVKGNVDTDSVSSFLSESLTSMQNLSAGIIVAPERENINDGGFIKITD